MEFIFGFLVIFGNLIFLIAIALARTSLGDVGRYFSVVGLFVLFESCCGSDGVRKGD